MGIKKTLRSILPAKAWRNAHYLYGLIRDVPHFLRFLTTSHEHAKASQKFGLLRQFIRIDRQIDCAHRNSEVIWFVESILGTPSDIEGEFAECGAFKGGSTAKFSLACRMAGRKLLVFDSFEGIPDNDEDAHTTLDGLEVSFAKGAYRGGLEEVKDNIAKCGDLEVCTFVKGYFDATMPGRDDTLAGIYLDVDLASSTRTCIEELYPKLAPGGWLMSQDGHLKMVLDVFKDPKLWQKLDAPEPTILGYGRSKLIRVQKPLR